MNTFPTLAVLIPVLSMFLLGIIVGSFLNVVILRHEKKESVTGRSYCPSCKKQLTWYELVPVFSYVLQRGTCRGCGTRISAQYPLVELATGTVFVLVYVHVIGPFSLVTSHLSPLTIVQLLLQAVAWSLLMVITVYDLRTKLIPDQFSFSFAAVALIATLLMGHLSLLALLAGPILFLPFYLLWKVSHGRWMGLGDGKLALGIGWFLGLAQGFTAIMFAFWIGAAVALLLLGTQRLQGSIRNHSKLSLKSEIPFGPFLVVGTLLVYVCNLNLFAGFVLY